ncbi:HAMP domain-containing histidine kinase [Sphingomonas sanguinis]|uniref:sensor histidine kinase n=1 Tax=Sphingomonas sanguinis TaxID=33051 RepID=UPI001C589653|nr:HAMP domain-containing sensor histidine kinase [Sphingomonas sanguinis]QXT35630.1 HAMP domain-containing histidine kinase [Sphingomonas sanguinis]
MGSRLALAIIGAGAALAWVHGLWLALAGGALAILALLLADRLTARRPVAMAVAPDEPDAASHRLLLDASPTPLLLIDGSVVRALNRAARQLFATDDRVLPVPPPLIDRTATHLRHAGRSWRADRVDVASRSVVALIDVESEERTAEARASAEMIQVLGHEMLNGLVPIVSLAECGLAAAEARDSDPALLPEILTTLARRAEGLQRFTEAYRSLARLPPPMRQDTALAELIDDLARLFAGRWPQAVLTVAVPPDLIGAIDRDQLSQALWALLQNAVEATGETGHVDLSVMASDRHWTIEVSDDGPGIPADRTAAIFRPFDTTKPTGSGIGLSLARRIAQGHGGMLDLLPIAPTTFRMRLPSDIGGDSAQTPY